MPRSHIGPVLTSTASNSTADDRAAGLLPATPWVWKRLDVALLPPDLSNDVTFNDVGGKVTLALFRAHPSYHDGMICVATAPDFWPLQNSWDASPTSGWATWLQISCAPARYEADLCASAGVTPRSSQPQRQASSRLQRVGTSAIVTELELRNSGSW